MKHQDRCLNAALITTQRLTGPQKGVVFQAKQGAFFCCFTQGMVGICRNLGRDVPGLENFMQENFGLIFRFLSWEGVGFKRNHVLSEVSPWSIVQCSCRGLPRVTRNVLGIIHSSGNSGFPILLEAEKGLFEKGVFAKWSVFET